MVAKNKRIVRIERVPGVWFLWPTVAITTDNGFELFASFLCFGLSWSWDV